MSRSFSKACSSGDMEQRLAKTKAEEVMRTDVSPVRETMLIEEAIRVMTEKTLKRLPVVDDQGHFTGRKINLERPAEQLILEMAIL